MVEERTAPKLRFKGFTEGWRSQKLGNYIQIQKTKNKNNLLLEPFSISNTKGFISQNKQFGYGNTYSKSNKTTNYIVTPGSFAYNPARINIGSIAYQNLNKPVLVSSLYEIFKVNQFINDSFLMNWFKTDHFKKQIKKLEEGGVRQYFFIDKMARTEIILPVIKEQSKITNLLDLLSKNISLQQRKLDLLKKVKKGFLQNLFPKNGVLVPNLRFKGFTDDWKQEKLSNISKYIKGYAFKSKDYRLNGIQLLRVSDLTKSNKNQKPIFLPKSFKEKYSKYLIIKNDLIITTVGSKSYQQNSAVGKAYLIRNTKLQLLNQNLIKLKSKQNHIFLYANLIKKRYTFFLSGIERGNANQANIAVKDLLQYRICIPTKQEQNSLGKIMLILDNMLNLQQQKIGQLKQFRKFLLQNMFI